jgi:hypothetical protein
MTHIHVPETTGESEESEHFDPGEKLISWRRPQVGQPRQHVGWLILSASSSVAPTRSPVFLKHNVFVKMGGGLAKVNVRPYKLSVSETGAPPHWRPPVVED